MQTDVAPLEHWGRHAQRGCAQENMRLLGESHDRTASLLTPLG